MEDEELDMIDVMELVKLLKAFCKKHSITRMTCGSLSIYYTEPPKATEG